MTGSLVGHNAQPGFFYATLALRLVVFFLEQERNAAKNAA
jgi:hypothetical protein